MLQAVLLIFMLLRAGISDISDISAGDAQPPAVINDGPVMMQEEDSGFTVEYIGDVPDDIKDTVDEYLSKIPPVILDSLSENRFKFVVDPGGQSTKNHAGYTIFPDTVIDGEMLHLKENTDPVYGMVAVMGDTIPRTKMAVIHEVGHAADFIMAASCGYSTYFENEKYMSFEGDPKWQEIYKKEQALSGFPDYNRTCALEYFAEVFRYIFEDPSKLDNIPESRKYVADRIESFYGIDLGLD